MDPYVSFKKAKGLICFLCLRSELLTETNSTLKALVIHKNIIMSSFKSSSGIQKKEGGPDSCFG